MRLIRATKTGLRLHLGQGEKRLLLQVLKLYPRVPSAHQTLSKSGRLPEPAANQRLLDEALAEQRAEHNRQLQALLADPRRFHEAEAGWQLSLSHAEAESVLQVLNDIRVGSWVILGSPEEPQVELNDATAPHLWAMEMAGYFQVQLLEALHGET